MELTRKVMNFDVKAVEGNDNVLEFTGSDETVDRAGDIMTLEGWDLESYLKNPVFMLFHDYRSLPVGKAIEVVKDMTAKKLRFKIEFPTEDVYPLGQTVKKLYQNKFLNATSVGFVPKKWEARTDESGKEAVGRKYLEQELLELSAVPVPCNPNALMESCGKGIFTADECVKMEESEIISRETLTGILEKLGVSVVIKNAENKIWEDDPDWTEIRYRVRNPDLFVSNSFRRKKMPGINIYMILGKLKG